MHTLFFKLCVILINSRTFYVEKKLFGCCNITRFILIYFLNIYLMSILSDSDSGYLNVAIVLRPSNQGGGSNLNSKSVNMETAQQKSLYF
jgi:hypothetical protein